MRKKEKAKLCLVLIWPPYSLFAPGVPAGTQGMYLSTVLQIAGEGREHPWVRM